VSSSSGPGASPVRAVLAFLFRHWLHHPVLLAAVVGGMLLATIAEILVPIFAGRLVDAVAQADAIGRATARDAALQALGILALLGLAVLACRIVAILGIIELTLALMARIGGEAFHRVQRFSAEWHANTFAGSTVRRISRGMWALDLLDDTLLLALLPSATVLVGATVMLGWRWPLMGALVAFGGAAYITVTVVLSLNWVAPAARLSNAWDTRIGGAMADAIGANAVVKAFGSEAREDARLAALLAKWQRRARRDWQRGTVSEALRLAMLVLLRVATIGCALWLW